MVMLLNMLPAMALLCDTYYTDASGRRTCKEQMILYELLEILAIVFYFIDLITLAKSHIG